MPSRFARLIVVASAALLLAVLLNLAMTQFSTTQLLAVSQQPAARPELTPTAVPTQWFSATALLTTSATVLTMGDALTVTAQLVTTGTCGFALYDVTLRQSDPLLAYVDPPDNVIGPPGANPAVWRLAAQQTGITTFTVNFFGETNCDGVWNWMNAPSNEQTVSVAAAFYLPFVNRFAPAARITDLGTLLPAPHSAPSN